MDDQRTNREGGELLSVRKRVAWLVLCIILVVVAPFVPLLLEIVEQRLFNSGVTAGIFQRLGLFEPLKELYQWLGLID